MQSKKEVVRLYWSFPPFLQRHWCLQTYTQNINKLHFRQKLTSDSGGVTKIDIEMTFPVDSSWYLRKFKSTYETIVSLIRATCCFHVAMNGWMNVMNHCGKYAKGCCVWFQNGGNTYVFILTLIIMIMFTKFSVFTLCMLSLCREWRPFTCFFSLGCLGFLTEWSCRGYN